MERAGLTIASNSRGRHNVNSSNFDDMSGMIHGAFRDRIGESSNF